MPLQII